jgi:hypothetical protein
MMRPQPLIAVADVEAGSRWFQQVLGVAFGHGGPNYEMLLDGGEIAAQLHQSQLAPAGGVGARPRGLRRRGLRAGGAGLTLAEFICTYV